jgi:hypothetical protein
VSLGILTDTPGINKHSTQDRLNTRPAKKTNITKLNDKQGTEKEHIAEGAGCFKCTREGRKKRYKMAPGTQLQTS